jgi:prolyl-tRNA editing enzyme YbaK/EbsC (Cys-tRNA(Pro) deacylase)
VSREMVESMPPELLTGSPRKVYDAAQALGLPIKVCMMAQSTKTADEAATACGCQVGQIVKSLIFRGRLSGKAMLFLVAGDNRLDENLAASFIGEELERPDGRFVREATGFAIGGIPPFGHARPLATIMDEDLLAHEVVWAAAGAPTAVFSIAPERLREATRARVARIKA